MTRPRVTVGIPVYNAADRLERSLRSVLDQEYEPLEIIISDNGSTDATVERIRNLAAGDERVTVLEADQNRGAAWNYNNVLEHATGEYFRWHADDDWFEPGLIGHLVDELNSDPEAVLAHTWTRFVDDDGETLRVYEDNLGVTDAAAHDRLESVICRLTFCNPVFGLIRREVLDRTARIATFPGSDVALLYELAIAGRFAVVSEPLYVRRPGNSIKSNPDKAALAEWFSPDRSGSRFPSLRIFGATVAAARRADLSWVERAKVVGILCKVYPRQRIRRLRRRRSRRQTAS